MDARAIALDHLDIAERDDAAAKAAEVIEMPGDAAGRQAPGQPRGRRRISPLASPSLIRQTSCESWLAETTRSTAGSATRPARAFTGEPTHDACEVLGQQRDLAVQVHEEPDLRQVHRIDGQNALEAGREQAERDVAQQPRAEDDGGALLRQFGDGPGNGGAAASVIIGPGSPLPYAARPDCDAFSDQPRSARHARGRRRQPQGQFRQHGYSPALRIGGAVRSGLRAPPRARPPRHGHPDRAGRARRHTSRAG